MKSYRELLATFIEVLGLAMPTAQARHHNQVLQDYCTRYPTSMKKLLALFTFSTLIVSAALADQQLVDYCKQTGGEIIQEWTCPQTGSLKTGESCKQLSADGKPMYFNGCSAPEGKYKTLFFKACIIHDLCYHHEPVTTGKSKIDCDNQFLTDMKKICKSTNPLSIECAVAAQTFYAAVDNAGEGAFVCSKEKVDYPASMDRLPLPSPSPFFAEQ